MGVITREVWAEVENSAYELWDLEMKAKKDYIPMMYNVSDSNRSEEKHLGVGSVGQMKPWNGTVDYQDFTKGFEKGYRHAKYSSGLQIEEEVFRFGEYRQIKDRVRKLNDSVYKTLQSHAVSTFNNANNAAFAGPDSVALCSASHPYSPSDATVQSNLGALDLTPANMNTVFNAMADFKDDKGDIVGVTPNLIICGNYYRDKAKKIVGSDKEPFSAENDMNTWADELTYMYNPRITGKTWFLADSQRMKLYLNWYNARKAALESDGDFDTEIMKFKVVSMFSYGWDHWDFIYGNFVS